MNKINVLYVEDDIATIEYVKSIFEDINNIKVIYALNGKEALDLYTENKFDLVITDMYMPKWHYYFC